MTGIELIAAERKRQIEEKGFTVEHDLRHTGDALAWAAVHFAIPDYVEIDHSGIVLHIYPELFAVLASRGMLPINFNRFGYGNRIRSLTAAGALIAAELDRQLAEERKAGEVEG